MKIVGFSASAGRKTAVAVAVLAAAAGCGASALGPRNPDPAWITRRTDPLLTDPLDIPRLASALAKYRGLPLRETVRVERSDADRLFEQLRGSRRGRARIGAFWRAFGVTAADDDQAARVERILLDGVSGFYDDRRKLVVFRGDDGRNESARAFTVVHELEHVLQDQASRLSHEAEGDEALARRALIEGDAEITSTAFVVHHRYAPDHWLPMYLAYIQAHSDDFPDSQAVPRFARRAWTFPYVEGTLFVGAMFRAGGYGLVDRVFEHPPVSTEQVLHPEKFLAGELPVPVDVPSLPAGYEVVDRGSMGELRTRLLLEQCEPGALAGADALGWGGDAYAIGIGTDGGAALLWSTAWDDETSARRFEGWMTERDECLARELHLGPPEAKALGTAVVRRANRVAYVRGLTPEGRATAAEAMLASRHEPPPPSPWTTGVRLRDLVDPQSFVGQGDMRGEVYVSPRLGLTLSTSGFDGVTVADSRLGPELTVKQSFGVFGVSGGEIKVQVLMTSLTEVLEKRLLWQLITPLGEAGLSPDYEGDRHLVTGAGDGHMMEWSSPLIGTHLLGFVPLCDGKITLLVYGLGRGRLFDAASGLLRSLRFDKEAPACAFAKDDPTR
jgi:hypothetical protein